MIQAELKGKVPHVRHLEDVLTSNVFGLLRYVDPNLWLSRIVKDFHAKAKEQNASTPDLHPIWSSQILEHRMTFWKKWEKLGRRGKTEPDLVSNVTFRRRGRIVTGVIVWEMKYHSELGHEQLLRELEGLQKQEVGDAKILVHLTPAGDRSMNDYRSQRTTADVQAVLKDPKIRMFHYTWQWLLSLLKGLSEPRGAIIEDLIGYLRTKGFDAFSGFSASRAVSKDTVYRYSSDSQVILNWSPIPQVDPQKGFQYGGG